MSVQHDELEYAGGGLERETNWWGALVIGLAGTILVTGIAPVMCFLLAELSGMMPERTGGAPSYAYPAYRQRWPRLAPHVKGITKSLGCSAIVMGADSPEEPGRRRLLWSQEPYRVRRRAPVSVYLVVSDGASAET